jgi:hypothetical protein
MNILVLEDGDKWRLWIQDDVSLEVAGPRLFRANPPNIQFVHDLKAQALIDASKLEEYVAANRAQKTKRKA